MFENEDDVQDDFYPAYQFPTVIDNTMRAEFVSCPRAFFNRFICHRQPAVPSIDLHAGGAFARGLEVARKEFYGNGAAPETAIGRGLEALWDFYGDFDCGDHVKSPDRMAGALEYYFSVFPLWHDHIKPLIINGEPTVEFNFVLPIPEVVHPETGEPILYSGRFDMLCSYHDAIFIEDDKTTKQLGATWANQWRLRSQFTGYVWGARKFGYNVTGAIIRGISILKNGYGNAEAIVYRPEWHIERWYAQLLRDLRRMIDCYRADEWDYSLADACSSYGGCCYQRVCDSPDNSWLFGPDYRTVVWNPAKPFDEEVEVGK